MKQAFEQRRLRHLFTTITGATPESQNPEYWNGDVWWVTPEDLGKLEGHEVSSTKRAITQEGLASCATTVAAPGSLVFSKRAPIGQAAILRVEAACNQGCFLLTPNDSVDARYYYYALVHHRPELEILGRGSTFMELSTDDLKSFKLPFPPLPTQHRIADYLDAETERIDELIAAKRSMLALLEKKRAALVSQAVTKGLDPNAKMKDSGLELGFIPAHWQPKRFKHLVSVWGRIGYRGYKAEDLVDEGQGALALGASHITADGKVDVTDPVYISWEKYNESPEIMVALNDLIVVQRGSCGKVGLVDRDLGPATINPSLVLLKDAKANPRFLLYVLLSNYIQQTIALLVSSTAVPMITQEQVNEFPVMVPQREEQDAIVEYLDRTTVGLDHLMQQVNASITLLVSRRSALITAAVTGQVGVAELVKA